MLLSIMGLATEREVDGSRCEGGRGYVHGVGVVHWDASR